MGLSPTVGEHPHLQAYAHPHLPLHLPSQGILRAYILERLCISVMLLTFSLSTNKLGGHSDRLEILLAGVQGFEPNDLTVLETAVLPLHQTPIELVTFK